MAEVIGSGNHGTPIVCTCPHCGTVFKYDRRDIWSNPKPGLFGPRYLVQCPECREELRAEWPY